MAISLTLNVSTNRLLPICLLKSLIPIKGDMYFGNGDRIVTSNFPSVISAFGAMKALLPY